MAEAWVFSMDVFVNDGGNLRVSIKGEGFLTERDLKAAVAAVAEVAAYVLQAPDRREVMN